jgi:hypothetical protein
MQGSGEDHTGEAAIHYGRGTEQRKDSRRGIARLAKERRGEERPIEVIPGVDPIGREEGLEESLLGCHSRKQVILSPLDE